VWKLEDRFIKEVVNKQGIKELKLKNVNRINQICDMVLICFIRILIEINKSYKLSEYRHHKGLNARMKNYKTRLGFGLHLGQSIEGAIGSMFKIDASYLSTNVNMANELEENTKTFKKELIMSGDFYDYLSEDAKSYVRLLDIFKTKSGQITRLYSIDLDLENIPIEKKKDSMFKEENIEKKWEIVKQKRKISKILYDDIVLRHKSDIWNEFASEEDEFKLVREKYRDVKHPLLIVYPIKPSPDYVTSNSDGNEPFMSFAISFPHTNTGVAVSYSVNQVNDFADTEDIFESENDNVYEQG
jgi:hypothetical protein